MTQGETVIIEGRFNGPPGSGNGGYVAGIAANCLGSSHAAVTLRAQVPLDVPLQVVRRAGDSLELRQGERLICEAEASRPEVTPPQPPFDWALAERLRSSGGSPAKSDFGHCLVCGRGRACGDGLQVWADRVPGRSGLSMALYTPHANHADADGRIRPEFLWGTLDCPGAWAAQDADSERPALTGRLTAEILHRPRVGERCLVLGWRTGADGRKLHSGTALFSESGTLCAIAQQLWIVLKS